MPNFLPVRWVLLVLALAVGLHLPAHLGKEALPGDGPVLASNPSLLVTRTRDLGRAAHSAFAEPEQAWASATRAVGRTRYRPVTTSVLTVERSLFGAHVVRGAAFVSLALHALLALLAAALVGRLRGPPAARLLAAVLVATCPAGLVAAAWPAQQAAVLGATLGTAGLLLCLSPRALRVVAGGVLLALAGLSHEVAFGMPLAALVLRPFVRDATPDEAPGAGRLAVLVPAALCLGLRQWGLGLGAAPVVLGRDSALDLPLVERLFVAVFDGAAGASRCLLAAVWPARLSFGDGAWQPGLLARASALVLLMVLVPFLARRLDLRAGRVAMATLVSLAAIPLARFAGGAAFHDVYLYIALPLVAATFGLTLTTLARGTGARRTVGIAVAALLVGAFVAGTLACAASFKDRAALIATATDDSGGSALARAWQLAEGVAALPQDPEARNAALRELDALASGIVADVAPADLGRQLGGAVQSAPYGRDAEAATFLSEPLMAYAQAVSTTRLGAADPIFSSALRVAATVTAVLPRESAAWSSLAAVRARVGDLDGALDAATKAYVLDPSDPQSARVLASVYLDFGSPADAVLVLDRLHDQMLDQGLSIDPDLRLFLAGALVGDGSTLERHGGRTQHRFERALDLLGPLESDLRYMARAKRLRYEAGLRYGDFLASQDAPQLALLAYHTAIDVAGGRGSAKLHRQWLLDRLAREEQAAHEALGRAQQGVGNVADALAKLAIVFCRKGDFEQADAVFTKLAESQGGMNPPLKFLFAKHRFGWSPEPASIQRAITLLEETLAEAPELHAAEFELAQLLERSGSQELALDRFRRVAQRAYLMRIGLEAAEHARRVEAYLQSR